MKVLRDDFPESPDRRGRWPPLDIDLVGDGPDIVPVIRESRAPAGAWTWVAAPGRAWSEPADGGGARLVLPVALEEANANCLHNGRLLVRFDRRGALVAATAQFDAEDCPYYRFDAWSRVPAAFMPGAVADAGAVAARHRAERASRPASASLEALHAAYPATSPPWRAPPGRPPSGGWTTAGRTSSPPARPAPATTRRATDGPCRPIRPPSPWSARRA
jgi:hypothetical protein